MPELSKKPNSHILQPHFILEEAFKHVISHFISEMLIDFF